MKTLLYVLLVANLGWFAWAQWVAPPATAAPGGSGSAASINRQPAAGRIQLLGEGGADGSMVGAPGSGAGSGPGAAPRIEPAAGSRCVAVGPFRDVAAVSAALAYLERHGHAPRVRPGAEFWIEISVDSPVLPAGSPETRFWEYPDMTTSEQSVMGDPALWQFAACETQTG